MRDYARYRVLLTAKQLLTAGLRSALRVGVMRRPSPRPETVTGSVVLLDRCLGLGDALMISPALRLLEPLGPVTVVTALPPLLDRPGEWLRCDSWGEMTTAADRLAAAGRLLLVPRLGVRGLLTLLSWRGGVPAGIVWLDPRTWLDTSTGRHCAIVGRHYTDGALACAGALLGQAGHSLPEVLPGRIPPRRGDLPAGLELPKRPMVALAPWATSRIRRWPLDHWSALIRRLAAARPELGFVLLGSADERRFGAEIAAGTGEIPVLNLMGRLPLAGTTTLIAGSALLVACDNGLMHLGLGTGTPLVAVFGSTDPAARLCGTAWRLACDPSLCPHGLAPCYPDLHRDPSCPTAIECLAGLAPERVAGLALELLETSL